jgi:DNA gyrase subunit A
VSAARALLRQAEIEPRSWKATSSPWQIGHSIRIIRDSRDRDDAKAKLMALSWTRAAVERLGILIRDDARIEEGRYKFSEKQVGHILDLRLYQLTGLEREGIKGEYDALLETIKDLLDIIAKESRVLKIIKSELREVQAKPDAAVPRSSRPRATSRSKT